MGRRVLLRSLAAAGAIVVGCTPPPEPPKPPPAPKADATVTAPAPPPPERELPPPSGPARELTLPAPAWDELANGVKVATIASAALPIVQIRVAVLAGSAADGDKPGLAALTGELLKEGGAGKMSGRELSARVESLGASLGILTAFDRTTLSIAVTKDQFAEALDLVATVTQKPSMNAAELGKLKKRMSDEALDRARTNGGWAALMMLHRQLFGGASGAAAHPYATYDATAADLLKLTREDCRSFHKQRFVPKSTFVVVAGDVTQAEVKAAADKAFGGMTGGEPAAVAFPAVTAPAELSITLVDRPKSTQSEVFVGLFTPERTAAEWPAFSAANQILGGGVGGRLFLEVREKQSLAYRTSSWVTELSHGPSVLVAHAGTQSEKTGLAVKAVLDQVERIGTTEPSAEEVATAARFLADSAAIRLETIGAIANELVKNRTLGLPDDYPSLYGKQVRAVTGAGVAKAAAGVRQARAALVVVGDAKVVGTMLSRFGEVKVVDPMKGFAAVETIAKDPEAALEVKEEAGK